MKRRSRYLYYSILFVLLQVFGLNNLVFAGVNDFYFKDFTGDYYLLKDVEGVSRLRVVEKVTAIFPNYNQNKGICRQIPYTNQGGKNVTLPMLNRSNLKLTRNGLSESIYSIDREDGYYNVCTGNDDYVTGEQTYTFEYEFMNVVTEFTENGREFQELYWDTNGNGSLQRFDTVTARLHFDDLEAFVGESWCYIGKYGDNGQDRCKITMISDGVEFSAKNLMRGENLTFDVELKAKSFEILTPKKNYYYVIVSVLVVVTGVVIIGYFIRKFVKSRKKAKYYKSLFVKPEYQPSDKYRLAEMAEIYIGKKKDMKVALLLEMVVGHNIELKKEKMRKWGIVVKNLSGVDKISLDLLAILNGGIVPSNGDTIEVRRRSANSKLIAFKKSMEKKLLDDLRTDGLVEKYYHLGGSTNRGLSNVIAMSIIIIPLVMMMVTFAMGILQNIFGVNEFSGQEMVFYKGHYMTIFIAVVITVMTAIILNDLAMKYVSHTEAGLMESRYMDGLKLYIKMAEAERIKFLQSVEMVDVDAEGVVKLYEKLLPYAAIFGLEESWINEMKKYCEVEEVAEPEYLMQGIVVSDLVRGLHMASTVATTATVMSNSGGISSSGFSGGGGGGFSGGGGGGGGFSGR